MFERTVNIVDPYLLRENEGKMLRSFVDEYHRCGGPKLAFDEVVLRFRMSYVQTLLDDASRLLPCTMQTSPEDFESFSGIDDEDFQSRYATRVFVTMLLSKVSYYVVRGDFKDMFDRWCKGAGVPYLTHYG